MKKIDLIITDKILKFIEENIRNGENFKKLITFTRGIVRKSYSFTMGDSRITFTVCDIFSTELCLNGEYINAPFLSKMVIYFKLCRAYNDIERQRLVRVYRKSEVIKKQLNNNL